MKQAISRIFPYKSASWYVLLALFIFITFLTVKDGIPQPLGWDNMGYYVYLSELFTDGDLRIEDLSHYQMVMDTYQNTGSLYQFIPVETELGGSITKYTAGWSILNAPVLYLGHLYASWSSYPMDGFSAPYQVAAICSSLLFTLLGLILMRKLLLRFFSEKLTLILLIILGLGTNYLHVNTSSTGMPHIYIFVLYTALLLFTIKFYENRNLKWALLIGINLGLLMLIRPTEIIAALIPLLYGITSFKELWQRILDFFRQYYYWVALGMVVLLYSLQLFYWNYTTGSYLIYTYTNPSEGLDLNKPYILEVLFSFRKGWFIYTPVMLLLIFGFVSLYKKKRFLFWGLFAFTLINLYIISCWTVWWYAGSFSSRALEHSYPIYIFVIGFGLHELKGLRKTITGAFIGLCIFLNLFQTWQMRQGILHGYNMTRAYYFSTFGQTTAPTPEQKKLLLIERGLTEFTNEDEYNLTQTIPADFDLPFTLHSENPYTPLIRLTYADITEQDHVWIKAYGTVEMLNDSINENNESIIHLCLTMQHEEQNYAWRNTEQKLTSTEKTTLFKPYLTPQLRTVTDDLTVGMWLQTGTAVKVTDLYFEIYEKNAVTP